ncbi:class I SAM-dependent methyltransferase [Stappia sp. 28M-7]|nr:class I SAM-dependent methyltransferase [Stappia sp. 28M-7]
MSTGSVESAYARWAPVYDWVFTAPLVFGQRAAAREANRLSGELVEVGVGTGLSLPLYGENLTVTGIDLSKPMLERARERVRRKKLKNVATLRAMDASEMDFDEARFDIATVMYVMTVVPDPSAVLKELERVVKPGGTVIIVNHFAADKGLLALIERGLARFASTLGWDPLFRRETVLDNTSMELVQEERLGPLGLFTMMVFRRQA